MTDLLGLPPDYSAHGQAIDHTMLIVHVLMLVLFVGWGIFFIYVLIRFRASKNKKANYHGVTNKISSYLEIGVAVFEAILLLAFAIPLWSERVDKFPATADSLVVRVVAQQFAWNIHYPGPDGVFGKGDPNLVDEQTNPLGLDRAGDPNAADDIVTLNQMRVPVNKPVIVHLTSKDVIHSFNLPFLRTKQDMIPGMSIPVWFTPTKTGSSEIACAQLCGLGHYRMKGFFFIDTQADFDTWLAEQGAKLTEPGDDLFD